MDKRGTAEAVDLVQLGLGFVPTEGFEWNPGLLAPGLPDQFLVRRPGDERAVRWPEDVWIDFYHLPARAETILEFANRYGWLHREGAHFHLPDGAAAEGEPLTDWCSALAQLRAIVDLWAAVESKDTRTVKRILSPLEDSTRRAAFPLALSHSVISVSIPLSQPFLVAKHAVVATVNRHLWASSRSSSPCPMPGCGRSVLHLPASAHAEIMLSDNGQPDMVIRSADLLTTIWVQCAGWIAGSRKIKRCEGCGRYMDVSESARPNSRRMHHRCEERLRKARYRAKIYEARRLAGEGKAPREIAALLETDMFTVKGWLK